MPEGDIGGGRFMAWSVDGPQPTKPDRGGRIAAGVLIGAALVLAAVLWVRGNPAGPAATATPAGSEPASPSPIAESSPSPSPIPVAAHIPL
ncbi:MAG: hypothetical protein ACHQ15_01190, partial [Candidatus Limnocylindrales bacterium]